MIVKKKEQKLTIDLDGPDGNAIGMILFIVAAWSGFAIIVVKSFEQIMR
jgi:hypothetical protein